MNLAETVKIARAGVLQFQTVPVPERDFLLETTPPSTWEKMEILLHTSRGPVAFDRCAVQRANVVSGPVRGIEFRESQ